ncbi:LOW QUALITY PROTEIN: bipolar DNA helicase [Bacillus sp. JCM 19046]|nr:LOW QUALITY PROTEIN: bipolar DNA helicase [Bacillus sp. JCM 19046]
MQIVGITTQHEVHVASKTHKFRMNEMLVIEDSLLHEPKGEVVETFSYNRYIPMGMEKGLVDRDVLETLEAIGYDIGQDDIHLAKVRLFEEAQIPIQTGASVRHPAFEEIKHLLLTTSSTQGMVLGEIKSTDFIAETIPAELSDLMVMQEQGETRAQNGVPFIFDIRAMQQYPHIGVFGGSGSGKSFGLRVMLEELMKLKIPALVFDPHFEMNFSGKTEAAQETIDYKQRYEVFQIGRDVGVDFSALNTRDVERLLGAAGSLTESMVNVIQTLHKKKDSYQSFSDRIANLIQALDLGKQKVDGMLHDGGMTREEIARFDTFRKLLDQFGSLPPSSVKGIQWRANRLNQAGLFQQNIRAIEQSIHNGKLVVVQGAVWLLQVFSSYVIGTLYAKRRSYKDAKLQQQQSEFFPPFVVVTDEAHNFAPKGYDAPAKSVLKEIAQEVENTGRFIFATQRPTLLDETITAQLNSKFVFRTVRGTDIQTIKEETDLTAEEGKRLPYLRSGDVFISSAIIGRTMAVRIRLAHSTSPHTMNPFDELDQMNAAGDEELLAALNPFLPMAEMHVMQKLDALNQKAAKSWDVSEWKTELERLCADGKLKKEKTPFATLYDLA